MKTPWPFLCLNSLSHYTFCCDRNKNNAITVLLWFSSVLAMAAASDSFYRRRKKKLCETLHWTPVQRSSRCGQRYRTYELGRGVELLGVGRRVTPVVCAPEQRHLILHRQVEEPLALREHRLQQAAAHSVVGRRGGVQVPRHLRCLTSPAWLKQRKPEMIWNLRIIPPVQNYRYKLSCQCTRGRNKKKLSVIKLSTSLARAGCRF